MISAVPGVGMSRLVWGHHDVAAGDEVQRGRHHDGGGSVEVERLGRPAQDPRVRVRVLALESEPVDPRL
jgi:hypothetical protein